MGTREKRLESLRKMILAEQCGAALEALVTIQVGTLRDGSQEVKDAYRRARGVVEALKREN